MADEETDEGAPQEHETASPPPSLSEVEAHVDRIRPGLIADGGNVEILGLDTDGTLRVTLQGECASCPAQLATLRVAIEAPLKRAIPGLTAVVAL